MLSYFVDICRTLLVLLTYRTFTSVVVLFETGAFFRCPALKILAGMLVVWCPDAAFNANVACFASLHVICMS